MEAAAKAGRYIVVILAGLGYEVQIPESFCDNNAAIPIARIGLR